MVGVHPLSFVQIYRMYNQRGAVPFLHPLDGQNVKICQQPKMMSLEVIFLICEEANILIFLSIKINVI